MAVITDYCILSMSSYLKDRIVRAAYKVGGSTFRTEIITKEILPDGRIAAAFQIDQPSGSVIPVSEIALEDEDGETLAVRNEIIERDAAQGGLLYRFRFSIHEKE